MGANLSALREEAESWDAPGSCHGFQADDDSQGFKRKLTISSQICRPFTICRDRRADMKLS